MDVTDGTTVSVVDPSARRALIAAWIGWMFDGYENYVFVLVMPIAMRQLVPPNQIARVAFYSGAVLAATLLGWATGGLVFGVLTDYVGRKRVLMLSIFWYACFSGLTYFSSSYRSLMLLRFMTGLGLGAEWGAGTTIVAELWPASWRGRAAGALQSAFGMGFFLASAIWFFIGPLGPQSWRYLFVIGVLPAFLLLYIQSGVEDSTLWLSARDQRRKAQRRIVSRSASVDDRKIAQFTLTYLMSDPVLRPRVFVLLVMSLSTVVGWWSISTWIPQYAGQLAAARGLNPQRWASLTGLSYNVGAILGYLIFGVLADLWGRKPAIQLFYAGALALSLCLFLLVSAPVTALWVSGINGFFTLGQFSWMTVYLPELFPTAVRGSAVSLVFNGSRFVAALGPLAAGWIIANTGSVAGPAAVMASVYALGLLAVGAAGPETRGKLLPS